MNIQTFEEVLNISDQDLDYLNTITGTIISMRSEVTNQRLRHNCFASVGYFVYLFFVGVHINIVEWDIPVALNPQELFISDPP